MAEEVKRCKKCTDLIGDLQERLEAWRAFRHFVAWHHDLNAYTDPFHQACEKLIELGELEG